MVDAQQRRDETVRHQYDQVCNSYRAIDDFRGKLLALWPILGGAAGGVTLLASDETSESYLWAVGLFGFFVSVGLAVYEWNQTLRCDLLKKVGRQLEREMRFEIGESQFLSVPRGYKIRAIGPSVPELRKLIDHEEQEFRGERDLTFLESIPEIRKGPLRVGFASLIVYGSVVVGWAGLFVWGLCQVF